MASHGMAPGKRLKIAVASGKGGTGKTLVATNLAVAIARTGTPVRWSTATSKRPMTRSSCIRARPMCER